VPAVAAALLAPLTKLGCGVLALEIPRDQQTPLVAWATGKTPTVPRFFAQPWEDGRGNIEALNLIRTALSPPFGWKLICFDVTAEDMRRELDRGNPDAKGLDSIWLRRDAAMASALAGALQQLAPREPKVLAICGNLHARTANHAQPGEFMGELWPSFAAALQRDHAVGRVHSVNIRPHGGGYFNGGKVNRVGGPPLDKAEAHLTPDADWDLQLDLPFATPPTFLSTPSNDDLPTAADSRRAEKAACSALRTTRPRCRLARSGCRRKR
jgi:hypothetical protein